MAAQSLTMVVKRVQRLTEVVTRLRVCLVLSLGKRKGRRRAPRVCRQWRCGSTRAAAATAIVSKGGREEGTEWLLGIWGGVPTGLC